MAYTPVVGAPRFILLTDPLIEKNGRDRVTISLWPHEGIVGFNIGLFELSNNQWLGSAFYNPSWWYGPIGAKALADGIIEIGGVRKWFSDAIAPWATQAIKDKFGYAMYNSLPDDDKGPDEFDAQDITPENIKTLINEAFLSHMSLADRVGDDGLPELYVEI